MIPGVVAAVGIVLVSLWLRVGTIDGLALRTPGMDRPKKPLPTEPLVPPVAGEPIASDGKPSEVTGAWPWFRGPNLDGISDDGVRLARPDPEWAPEVLWTIELGRGHAGAAVAAGRVFVLDYDTAAEADTMRCLSLDDGREVWRNSYPVAVVDNHGMSRTVPAVIGDCVVSIGPRCHVACWDMRTGECRWLLDMVLRYRTTVPEWYTGQCPLIDGDRVILAPAGDAFMIALDYESGEVVWESPKLHNWQMTHSSILPVEFGGRRMYVYCGSKGVAGIAATDGSLSWETSDWVGNMATCPTPVPVGDGQLFFCGGYNAGSLMMQLEEQQDRLVAKPLFRLRPRQFASEQHTPIFFDGHLYGVRTKRGGNQLTCIDLDGNELWNSGTDKFERGPYLIADGLIYVMDSEGLLVVAEATPQGYRPLGRFQVFDDGHDAWGPMALAGGRLILRDLTRMSCLDVAEQ